MAELTVPPVKVASSVPNSPMAKEREVGTQDDLAVPPSKSVAQMTKEAASAIKCFLCSSAFGLFRRRHMCKKCLRAVCSKCSGHRISIQRGPTGTGAAPPVRVCNNCYKEYVDQQLPSPSSRGRIAQMLGHGTAQPNIVDDHAAHIARTKEKLVSLFRPRIRALEKTILAEMESERSGKKKDFKREISAAEKKITNLGVIIKKMNKDLGNDSSASTDSGSNAPSGPRAKALQQAQDKYQVFVDQKRTLELEYYFPQMLNLKFRLSAEDGVCIGLRDIGLQHVRGRFELVAKNGVVDVRLKDFRAVIQLYGFQLAGKKKMVKFLSAILSPSRVSVRVESKELRVPMVYDRRARQWRLGDNATFALHVMKTIKGAASAPDAFINWLAHTILPSLAKVAVEKGMPTELGVFLSKPGNNLSLAGNFDVHGDITEQLWHAELSDFSGSDKNCAAARKKVGITRSQALVLSAVGKAGKFDAFRKGLSLGKLFEYYQMYSIKKKGWLTLVDNWQEMLNRANPELAKQDARWFASLMREVQELGKKYIDVRFHITKVEVEIDVQDTFKLASDLYIKAVRNAIEDEKHWTEAQRLVSKLPPPEVRIKAAEDNVQALLKAISTFAPMVHRANLSVVGKMSGGSQGILELDAADITIDALLPKLMVEIPRSLSRTPLMNVEAVAGPKGYTVTIALTDPEYDLVYKYKLMLSGIKLDLFSPDSPAGSVVAKVNTFVFKGPLASLLDITRFFQIEADHSVPAPKIPKNILHSSTQVHLPNLETGISDHRLFRPVTPPPDEELSINSPDLIREKSVESTPSTQPSSVESDSLLSDIKPAPLLRSTNNSPTNSNSSRSHSVSLPQQAHVQRGFSDLSYVPDDDSKLSVPSVSTSHSAQSIRDKRPHNMVRQELEDAQASTVAVLDHSDDEALDNVGDLPSRRWSVSDVKENPFERHRAGSGRLRGLSVLSPQENKSAEVVKLVMEYLTDDAHQLKVGFGVRVSVSKKAIPRVDPPPPPGRPPSSGDATTSPSSRKSMHATQYDNLFATMAQQQQHAGPKPGQALLMSAQDAKEDAQDNKTSSGSDKRSAASESIVIAISTTSSEDECVDVEVRTDLQGMLHDIMSLL